MLTQEMLSDMLERVKKIRKRATERKVCTDSLMYAYDNLRNLTNLVAYDFLELNDEKVLTAYKAVIANIETLEKE